MHLVGFIIRIYHDARSPERQIDTDSSNLKAQRQDACIDIPRLIKLCLLVQNLRFGKY